MRNKVLTVMAMVLIGAGVAGSAIADNLERSIVKKNLGGSGGDGEAAALEAMKQNCTQLLPIKAKVEGRNPDEINKLVAECIDEYRDYKRTLEELDRKSARYKQDASNRARNAEVEAKATSRSVDDVVEIKENPETKANGSGNK